MLPGGGRKKKKKKKMALKSEKFRRLSGGKAFPELIWRDWINCCVITLLCYIVLSFKSLKLQ